MTSITMDHADSVESSSSSSSSTRWQRISSHHDHQYSPEKCNTKITRKGKNQVQAAHLKHTFYTATSKQPKFQVSVFEISCQMDYHGTNPEAPCSLGCTGNARFTCRNAVQLGTQHRSIAIMRCLTNGHLVQLHTPSTANKSNRQHRYEL